MNENTAQINLGTSFTLGVQGLAVFPVIGKAVKEIQDSGKSIGASFLGDWRGFIRYWLTMPQRMNQSLQNTLPVIGKVFHDKLLENWEGQSLDWQPLAADYLAAKVRQGLDDRVLIASQNAIESLGFRRESPLELVVGVTAESEDGFPYMVVHEFGSADGKIEPRPLFMPTLDWMLGADTITKITQQAIQEALKGGVYRGAT